MRNYKKGGNTGTGLVKRLGSNLLLYPAGQYLARMLADLFAKAKLDEAAEKPRNYGGSNGGGSYGGPASKRGYESKHYRAHWRRWYKAEQKAQRQFSAIKHHRYRFRRESLSLKDVA